MAYCKNCAAEIEQIQEKALAEPRDEAFQLVWATEAGDWICPVNQEEHEPGGKPPIAENEGFSTEERF